VLRVTASGTLLPCGEKHERGSADARYHPAFIAASSPPL
jgi:hypothetical protein